MSTKYFGGDIAYRASTGTVFAKAGLADYGTDAPRASEAPVKNTDFTGTPWSPWGTTNNMLPKEIAEDIENIGALDAALDAIGKIATGKGIQPHLLLNIDKDGKEETEWVNDSEILDFLEDNNYFKQSIDSIYDNLGYGWNAGSLVMDIGQKKIERLKRHDIYEARLQKKDRDSKLIKNIYLSAEWEKAGSVYDPNKQSIIPLLEEGYEYADLMKRVKGNSKQFEFAYACRTIRNGRHYYPQPTYRSNKVWLKIARSVPAFKIAMFKNQITLNYIVTIHPKFWEDKIGVVKWRKYTEEQRRKAEDEYYDKIEKWLVGEDNAYKTLFNGSFINAVDGKPQKYIEVEVVDNKLKDGQLLPDSGAALSEIHFSLMINPALMGAGNPGGKAYGDTGGGSNIRESFLVQMMLRESERKENAGPLNIVKKYNGWAERLEVEREVFSNMTSGNTATVTKKKMKPRLVWRYQSGLLTTLDTGKSTKPENL